MVNSIVGDKTEHSSLCFDGDVKVVSTREGEVQALTKKAPPAHSLLMA